MGDCNRPIGVFDSGLGGISVLKELVALMPNEDFIYFGDSYYAPYGIKDKEAITERCIDICDFFIEEDVKAIVIACNTATSVAVDVLRDRYKDIPIIGMEPALKVAAENACSNKIVVMATPLTLSEKKFNRLMEKYSDKNTIIKMPCPELVEIVENDEIDDAQLVTRQLQEYFKTIDLQSVDSIVLGCTHFVFFKKYIAEVSGNKVKIIDGNNGTARHLSEVLDAGGSLKKYSKKANIIFFNSSAEDKYIELSKKLFKL